MNEIECIHVVGILALKYWPGAVPLVNIQETPVLFHFSYGDGFARAALPVLRIKVGKT